MRRIFFLFIGLLSLCGIFAQSGEVKTLADTIKASGNSIPPLDSDLISKAPRDSIIFTTSSASEYISNLVKMNDLWRPAGDTLRHSLTRLIDHFNEPFDSVENRLSRINYDSLKIRHIDIVRNDTLPLRWLNDETFIIDTVSLEKEPFITRMTIIETPVDTSTADYADLDAFLDAMLENEKDTITDVVIDTLYLESKKIQMHTIVNKKIVPPVLLQSSQKYLRFLPDSGNLVLFDTLKAIVADRNSPFYVLPNEKLPDSLRMAVTTLLSYFEQHDSTLLYINDFQGGKTPIWLTKGNDELYRYWVKNFKNDSITIWMGNPSKNNLSIILEDDINVNRPKIEKVDDFPITTIKPQISLAQVKPLKEIPIYWTYNFVSSFGLNQTYLSNWAKGGENSLSSVLDIVGTAKYTNNEAKTQWTNSGRLKYGNIITEEYGSRTTTDMIELNSQYNKKIKGKVDLSSVFYFKTQAAKGYKYPNDSVPISKFLNPGTFTLGVGFEYKPFKQTLINFSPLSWKSTFVLDTTTASRPGLSGIDQTRHGIEKDKKSRQELGGQLLIKNSMTVLDGTNISNTIRLFSNYIDNPQNVDVDWEMTIDRKINWYFTVQLNLHMIYDHDIRFPVLDDNDLPVLLPDGKPKEAPKMQFKEFLGLTLLFKF